MRRRRAHTHVVGAALRRGRFGWLMRATTRALRMRLGLPAGPLFATLAVTWRCNYRCRFCDLPDRARGDPPYKELVERLRDLKRRGALAVGITGGEPLLHARLFDLLAEARRLDLLVHLNSNGSRLAHEKIAPLLDAGLHSLNVSLDGAQAATHDGLRGVPGSFRQIERTIGELLARRRRGSPRIALVMAVTPENAGEVVDFARLAQRWGVDAAGFLPEHAFVPAAAPPSPSPSVAAWSPEKLSSLAADLERAAREVALVDNSPAYLAGFAPFLAGAAMPTRCSAGTSHLAVDPEGRSYPCVPLMTLERSGVPLREVNGRPLLPSPADLEEVCRRCWWNCHRELDLSLNLLEAPALPRA
jgi:MoaA/NifB/PqqE/SkfB family radical SAM enzyme